MLEKSVLKKAHILIMVQMLVYLMSIIFKVEVKYLFKFCLLCIKIDFTLHAH